MKERIYHRAAQVNQHGNVAALCFSKPRRINLRQAMWTLRDEAVTCPKCKALIAARTPKEPTP